MRSGAASLFGLNFLWLLLGVPGFAQDSQPSEYQIKSAFLFNFAKFVEWPANAFSQPKSPLVIGILGDNPFGEDLQKTIRNKSVDDHPLEIKELSSAGAATNCHILFISTSEKPRLPQILGGLKGSSVLTVGEMDRFTESGGMINFVKVGTKIRFQINNGAAADASLKISSKLLNLALRPGG
jgi:hypothetical protein